MIILKKTVSLTDQDTQTNIKIPFTFKKEGEKLKVSFTYSPPYSSDDAARLQVENAVNQYIKRLLKDDTPEEWMEIEQYLPIENFITLSLSKDGEYLGGHHNKAKEQNIFVTKDDASLGFWPTEIKEADWEIQLNCHCIASQHVEATIKVEVI